MNIKWKVALLTLLGFSTAACCGTKKTSKSEDKNLNKIEAEEEDPKIMLMYGVPFPDGRVVVPVDENGKPIEAKMDGEGVPMPGGRIVKPISEEEAKKLIEELKREEAKKLEEEAVDVRPMLMYGVPFPNGEVVRPISEQEAEEKINEIAEEKSEATE
jgi:hypothetical protein